MLVEATEGYSLRGLLVLLLLFIYLFQFLYTLGSNLPLVVVVSIWTLIVFIFCSTFSRTATLSRFIDRHHY
jgi:hypothetical protein